MKRNLKYYFNPESLTYEKYTRKLTEKIFRATGILGCLSLVCILGYSVFVYRSSSPGEKKLRQELSFYKKQVEILNSRFEDVNNTLSELEKKDNQIYRIIFEADPLPANVQGAGIGGSNSYDFLTGFTGGESLIESNIAIDTLSAKLSVLTSSYKDLLKLAKAKEKTLASMPAIQPVSNKELNRIASGFGYRIHPIYKQRKMHTGLDFAAAQGTEVYATGDGVVEEVTYNPSGYGRHIIINHGYGYKTIYAHLSKTLVRQGQKVKRGEEIGKVGSTGVSTAPHLHYEVVKNGTKVNPINFFHNDLKTEDYEKMIQLANQANQSFD